MFLKYHVLDLILYKHLLLSMQLVLNVIQRGDWGGLKSELEDNCASWRGEEKDSLQPLIVPIPRETKHCASFRIWLYATWIEQPPTSAATNNPGKSHCSHLPL